MDKCKNELFNNKRRVIVLTKNIKGSQLDGSWPKIRNFLGNFFKRVDVSNKGKFSIMVASEEIYVNISKYAYQDGNGEVEVKLVYSELSKRISIIFLDSGMQFDPTKQKSPNFKDPLICNRAGGRGIFIAKKMCDRMKYVRSGGKNILIISKNIE